ncbi:MAG TPA: triphosphoribosyl-dephospho-CoA synthase [Gemmataceae bacterium]|nr:triphosphoribosyl-dephospho-CoA synthase [Gemmataceae bacterium]
MGIDAAPEPIREYAQFACLWEATARKPGNVHRFADFEDTTYLDFVASAIAFGKVFDMFALANNVANEFDFPVGARILRAIEATQEVTKTNTNLGIVLLLVPLAKTHRAKGPRLDILRVLNHLTIEDAQDVYKATALARPAGMGKVDSQDLSKPPTQTLLQVMTLAADRDLIARQYANGFREVFDEGVPALQQGLKEIVTLEDAIIHCHLQLMARHPDSLIARKCGKELAEEASQRAAAVVAAGWPHTTAGRTAIVDFDKWLRADGHRRNPGTTADLVAACLFVALREGIITLPPKVPWSAG